MLETIFGIECPKQTSISDIKKFLHKLRHFTTQHLSMQNSSQTQYLAGNMSLSVLLSLASGNTFLRFTFKKNTLIECR